MRTLCFETGARRETGWDIDCIVPVPDGSRPAAIQMSAELGLPYREGLVKNRYVGRTFIMPDQVPIHGATKDGSRVLVSLSRVSLTPPPLSTVKHGVQGIGEVSGAPEDTSMAKSHVCFVIALGHLTLQAPGPVRTFPVPASSGDNIPQSE